MKIAVVHSFYESAIPSGENMIVEEQIKLLRDNGHQVKIFSKSTDDLKHAIAYKVNAARNVISGDGYSPLSEIEKFGADVVHIHNLFPNFGTSWIMKCTIPTVTTIHNYRALCANGLFFRASSNCFECLTNGHKSALIHRCYRNSFLATIPLAVRNAGGLLKNPQIANTDAVIFLNEMAASIHIRNGCPTEKTVVIPNGIRDPKLIKPISRATWVCAARLTSEKGIYSLAQMWPEDITLHIYGDGPERKSVEQLQKKNIILHGQKSHQEVLENMAGCQGVVIPSECLEMQPTVAIEAMSLGVPLLARVGNSAAELVDKYKCGATYSLGTDLDVAMQEVVENRESLTSNCINTYKTHFSEESWLLRITKLYDELANRKKISHVSK